MANEKDKKKKKVNTASKSKSSVENKEKKIVKEVSEKKKVSSETKKDILKKVAIALCVVILLVVLFGISEGNNEKYVQPETFTDEEQAELNSINVDDYLKLKAGSSPSVIYIARPTCSHCVVQTPRMKYIKYKYKTEINYLNTDEFDEEGKDYEKLQNSDSYFDEGLGTPTILIVQNDEIIDDISGESEVSTVVSLLKKYDLIEN